MGLLLAGATLVGCMTTTRAAEPRDYSYLFVQGKLTKLSGDQLDRGVTVRLAGDGQTFEATADKRGVFVFEKLPVAEYSVRVTTSDGRVIRSIRSLGDEERIRLEIATTKKAGVEFTVRPAGQHIAVDLPKWRVNWSLFWKEVAIIVGVALLFAL